MNSFFNYTIRFHW